MPIFQDTAGLQPGLDDSLELSPIDMGHDHFTVNNLNYHGSDLSWIDEHASRL